MWEWKLLLSTIHCGLRKATAAKTARTTMDLFKPLPPLKDSPVDKETRPLTARSVVVGLVFGSLVTASSNDIVYLG